MSQSEKVRISNNQSQFSNQHLWWVTSILLQLITISQSILSSVNIHNNRFKSWKSFQFFDKIKNLDRSQISLFFVRRRYYQMNRSVRNFEWSRIVGLANFYILLSPNFRLVGRSWKFSVLIYRDQCNGIPHYFKQSSISKSAQSYAGIQWEW